MQPSGREELAEMRQRFGAKIHHEETGKRDDDGNKEAQEAQEVDENFE